MNPQQCDLSAQLQPSRLQLGAVHVLAALQLPEQHALPLPLGQDCPSGRHVAGSWHVPSGWQKREQQSEVFLQASPRALQATGHAASVHLPSQQLQCRWMFEGREVTEAGDWCRRGIGGRLQVQAVLVQ